MVIICVFIKWNIFWNGKIGFYSSIHTSGTWGHETQSYTTHFCTKII